jgi:hypothetical protein
VGQSGETVRSLRGQIQTGRSPITHGSGPLATVDLETVQLSDQDDLTGPEAGDGSLRLYQFLLPRLDLLIDRPGLSPPIHTAEYEPQL